MSISNLRHQIKKEYKYFPETSTSIKMEYME